MPVHALDLSSNQADTLRMKSPVIICISLLLPFSFGGERSLGQMPVTPAKAAAEEIRISPSELEIYKTAHTLIDWTPHEVKDRFHKLRPAENQDQLPMLLDHAGDKVSALLRDLPRVSCDEELITESSQARVKDTQHHKFRYIVIPYPEDIVPTFEEYRTEVDGKPLNPKKLRYLPLVTYNFSSTMLLLSPVDQRESKFRYFGVQTIRGRECYLVGFAQDPAKAHRVGRFTSQGKSCAMLLQGVAWLDSETFDILQINTWLLAPREDFGIRMQFSSVQFFSTPIGEATKTVWLPRDVSVYVVCGQMFAHNTHHYTNYKLFSVESTIKVGE
jgi:hypothetical protein